jgi:hypothetical protein
MTDPLSFPSITPRHALPMLFAGQAQKEASVNGAHALTDMLLHPAIEGEAAAEPVGAGDGECWLVSAGASGAFAGRDHALAGRQAGTWLFAEPREGMRVYDRASAQFLLYAGGWRREPQLAEPAGGDNADLEARSAIVAIMHLLRRSGMLPDE